MRLDPDELVFGVKPWILVDCASQLHDLDSFCLEGFAEALGVPVWEAAPVLASLTDNGYLTLTSEGHEPASRFHQLANAHLGPGIPRWKADELVAAVVAKAHEINTRQEAYRCRVVRLVVFGSYLTDAPLLGDVDLGVELEELRPRSTAEAHKEVQDFLAGRRTAAAKVISALRLRKPRVISLHKMEEVFHLETPYSIVFDASAHQLDRLGS